MLSAAQIQHYGKRWGAVCKANDWRMQRGRLHPNGRASAGRSPLHGETFALAEQHARANSRAVTVEDLRRAAGARITGRFQSAKTLANAQFTRLLTLFKLLIDPDDLGAMLGWLDPERDRARYLESFIRAAAPEAYTRAICEDRFKTGDWRQLGPSDLTWLANTLRKRRAKLDQPIEQPF